MSSPVPDRSPAATEDRAAVEARARASRGISGGASYYAWAVSGLERELPRAKAILDLACGRGEFGRFLGERFGQKPHGVDVVRHEGFEEAGYASLELHDLQAALPGQARYDYIFALGFIEYLPNPRAFFRNVAPMIAPGGRLVCTAPNPASLRSLLALALRGEFSAFRAATNPASITPVLAVDAARMMREAGLADVQVDFSGGGRIPLGGEVRYPQGWRGRWWSDDFRCVARATA